MLVGSMLGALRLPLLSMRHSSEGNHPWDIFGASGSRVPLTTWGRSGTQMASEMGLALFCLVSREQAPIMGTLSNKDTRK